MPNEVHTKMAQINPIVSASRVADLILNMVCIGEQLNLVEEHHDPTAR